MTGKTESENSEPPAPDALARNYLNLWQDQRAAKRDWLQQTAAGDRS